MTDSTLNRFVAEGTHTQRLAFTPTPPTPASGPAFGYFWLETDTGLAFAWNQATTAWVQLGGIPNAVNNSRLLGSIATGAGSPYSELIIGSGLTLTGSTLTAAGATGETEFGVPPAINPNSAVILTSGFFFCKAIVAERTGTINSIKLQATAAQAANLVTPGVYSNSASNTVGTLLSAASQATGVVQGLNKYPLSSGAAVTKGNTYWIGFSIQNGGGTIASLAATAVHASMIAFFANTGVLPGTAPAASYAGTWGTFWASADT